MTPEMTINYDEESRFELAELRKKYRELENQYILQGLILESIECLLNGDEVSDFDLSLGIVYQV